jgi:uncharacterized protein YecE (DUF72 family)
MIAVGTSSWTDPTLIASGWYPTSAKKNATARLRYYAARFKIVEVDSTYYAPPSEANAVLWAERTPADFTFNVKAFSLMTHHPTPVKALPVALRDAAGGAERVYQKDLPPAVIDEMFERFASALMPLHSAGKLGCILFQFPEWFLPSAENRAAVEACAARLPDYQIAVEFRQSAWLADDAARDRTFGWLRDKGLPYVSVDMPQGFASSMPPIAEVTSEKLAVVRFHGRNTDNWKRRGVKVVDRFDYAYSQQELFEWVPKVRALHETARDVHVMFNNCYADKGVTNAAEMAALLAEV